MSGRSAYVRKKIESGKDGKGAARNRAKSSASHDRDDVTISDFPLPGGGALPVGTGVGTTNARFLKFSDPSSSSAEYRDMRTRSVSSGGSAGSADARRGGAVLDQQDEYAYGRSRRPTFKTEDVSGIEKSGLRSKIDKKSDDVRKGLAKTFAFRKKEKDERRGSLDKSPEYRPHSAATVRAHAQSIAEEEVGYDAHEPQSPDVFPGSRHRAKQEASPWDGMAMSPPPTAKLPPVPPPSSTPPIKRWIGSGRPVQRWNKLRKDPELWDPNGDVLVFFGHKGQTPRPNPSFRLSSHIIEATESRYLLTMLREGSTEEDLYLASSPPGAPPMLRHDRRRGHGVGHGGQPTPPMSEDASSGEADGQISYEMYFPSPPNLSKVDQLRHHITTRNVFALLYHASIVGITLHQALTDLHSRLDAYLPVDSDNVATIVNYLVARGLDDVRNDMETAVSLLAWSEGPHVRWDDGWREAFLHSAGMYGQLEQCADFKSLTPITRALLERACLETQLRVQAAEERLHEMQCPDMWPSSGAAAAGQAKAAADRLQKFFIGHYTKVFGRWPPPTPAQQTSLAPDEEDETDGEDMWLTRTVAQSLQKDFGALYDYLVNRDVVWDMSEARSGRKWMMVSETGNHAFTADIPDLPMTDMIVEFDNKMRFPHIPHPFPLVPESIPPPSAASTGGKESSSTSSSMFKSSKKVNNSGGGGGGASGARIGALERRVQLAYTEATNIYILGSEFTQSDLIDAFVKFEKSDRVGEVDPALARRGRWVLIYSILQVLASVSVDAPGVRYKEDVPYHLSPRLKGTKVPPWKSASSSHGARRKSVTMGEAAHELSHCWIVAGTWEGGHGDTDEELRKDMEEQEGEDHDGDNEGQQFNAYKLGVGGVDSSESSPVFGGSQFPIMGASSSGGSGGGGGGGGSGSWGFPRPPAPRGLMAPSSGAQSVVSESDAGSRASSSRSRSRLEPGAALQRVRSRDNVREQGGNHGGTGTSLSSSSRAQHHGPRPGPGYDRFESTGMMEYPARRKEHAYYEGTQGVYGGRGRGPGLSPRLPPSMSPPGEGIGRPPRIRDFDEEI